mmetsp:Transcript_99142/g.181879  ORF Transcript_99142/g.181879 Transcript_99142/m.181879 type:complete len:205 (+) Transcript_99142:619-1233(+)
MLQNRYNQAIVTTAFQRRWAEDEHLNQRRHGCESHQHEIWRLSLETSDAAQLLISFATSLFRSSTAFAGMSPVVHDDYAWHSSWHHEVALSASTVQQSSPQSSSGIHWSPKLGALPQQESQHAETEQQSAAAAPCQLPRLRRARQRAAALRDSCRGAAPRSVGEALHHSPQFCHTLRYAERTHIQHTWAQCPRARACERSAARA